MKLYYSTVSELLLECLRKLMADDTFNDFVLVGGTALSLQLGHRMSVDIDLFTSQLYGSMDLEKIRHSLEKMFVYTAGVEMIKERDIGYSVYVGNSKTEYVKLDLYYTDDFIAPIVEADGLRLASLQDLAGMKMQAIANSKRKKDFWDIHELLDNYSLKELIQCGLNRNPYTLTEDIILTALYNLTELTQDNVIHCFRGKFWELIIDDIRNEVKRYRETYKI